MITRATAGGAARDGTLLPALLNVEDFEPSRYLRTRLFRRASYDVVEAASAGEALTAARRQPLSVAVIDVNLPDASGIVLCDTLKRLTPDLPVLLISAVSVDDDVQRAGLAAGAHAYLAEPVSSEKLLRCVTEALEGPTRPRPSEVWIMTDQQGTILETSARGARLLSGTVRGLQHRSLLVFFDQDRDVWREAMTRAAQGQRVLRSGRLRPKERRPITVRVEIETGAGDPQPALLWTFTPDTTD